MRFFFRSRQFKVILAATLGVIATAVICIIIGGNLSPQANIFGTITAPFSQALTGITNTVKDFAEAYSDGTEIMLENSELEAENIRLKEQLAEYEQALNENEFYKEYLEIKEQNPDFKFADATLISTDTQDPYKGFVINRGSLAGISEKDPVITSGGLVGFVSDVGLTTSKVTTILSPDITLGALDNRTNDAGVLSGTLELAGSNKTRLFNLSRSCNIAVGDFVVTSGEGVFPEGLLIGSITSVGSDEYNTSIFAEVEPFVNIGEIRQVMVITEFEGQGALMSGGDK